jgi:hypothetical protein
MMTMKRKTASSHAFDVNMLSAKREVAAIILVMSA